MLTKEYESSMLIQLNRMFISQSLAPNGFTFPHQPRPQCLIECFKRTVSTMHTTSLAFAPRAKGHVAGQFLAELSGRYAEFGPLGRICHFASQYLDTRENAFSTYPLSK